MHFEEPILTINNGISESVFMDSGCLKGYIIEEQYEGGDGNKYRFKVVLTHEATNHRCSNQDITLAFNFPVTISDGNASGFYVSGSGTTTLVLRRNSPFASYNNENTDFQVVVKPVSGPSSALKVTDIKVSDDNYQGDFK